LLGILEMRSVRAAILSLASALTPSGCGDTVFVGDAWFRP
jgi:hypothetical protein